MDKATFEMLRESGREIAEGLLRGAVETASSSKVLTNHVMVLEIAAIHILARTLFSSAMSQGKSSPAGIVGDAHRETELARTANALRKELRWVEANAHELILVKPGDLEAEKDT